MRRPGLFAAQLAFTLLVAAFLAVPIAMSAALSVGLGLVAWAALAMARSLTGGAVAAAG